MVLGKLKASPWGSEMQVKEFSSTLSQRLHPVCYHLEGNRQGRLQGSQSTFLNLWFLLRVALPFNLYTKPCAVKVKMAGNILWWSRNNLHQNYMESELTPLQGLQSGSA